MELTQITSFCQNSYNLPTYNTKMYLHQAASPAIHWPQLRSHWGAQGWAQDNRIRALRVAPIGHNLRESLARIDYEQNYYCATADVDRRPHRLRHLEVNQKRWQSTSKRVWRGSSPVQGFGTLWILLLRRLARFSDFSSFAGCCRSHRWTALNCRLCKEKQGKNIQHTSHSKLFAVVMGDPRCFKSI